MKVDSKVDTFFAIALPRVHTDKLEVDFPLVSRDVLKDKPSAKMAIRLLKCVQANRPASRRHYHIEFNKKIKALYFLQFLKKF